MMVSAYCPPREKCRCSARALRDNAFCQHLRRSRSDYAELYPRSLTQPVRTYGYFSHACTVSSINELEKYFICIVSILLMLAFSAGVAWRYAQVCAHADFTSSPMIESPAVYVT